MNKQIRKKLYFDMLRIRKVEMKISELYSQQEMRCPIHLSIGQEAVAVGVCSALEKDDQALSAHRSHAHYLAKGGNLKSMLAEIYGKATGCTRGKGGSMHLIDLDAGLIAAVPIVGSTIPIAVGASWGTVMKNKRVRTAVFFGEGAAETGVFHESLGIASLHSLPIIFVCENNLYSVYSGMEVRQSSKRSNLKIAEAHGICCLRGEGNDVNSVLSTTKKALKIIEKEKGPVFLEFETYRWLEHCGPDDDDYLEYRDPKEVEKWKKNCPLEHQENILLKEKLISTEEISEVSKEIDDEIEQAFDFAKSSPFSDKEELYTSIYSD